MTELLPLPKINTKNDLVDDFPTTPVELLSEDKLSHILTNVVRQKYFNFLEKLLADNYENSLCPDDTLSITDIKKCAEYLEFKAVRSCMIVNLYRKAILNIFAEIKNDTEQKKLNINLSTERICQRKTRRNVQIQTDLRPPPMELNNPPKPTKRKHLRNVRVQTDFIDATAPNSDSEYTISLDERIKNFEKKFREGDQNQSFLHNVSHCFPTKKINLQDRFKENRKRRHSSISLELESPHSSVDSSIHRSVERTDSRIDSCNDNEILQLTNSNTNIFATPDGAGNVTTADDNIAQEMMVLFGDDEDTDIFGEVINTVERSQHSVEHSEKLNEGDCTAKTKLESCKATMSRESKKTQDDTHELKNSKWPCELHMQRMKLREALVKKADKGFRYSEKLKKKFEQLFGPEDDEDCENSFAPYSPTIELDEILMSSCKKRIAPWIVKHLKPISDGLIENRFLFKKVAKHIAETVILLDQFPDEQKVKRAIVDFFNNTHGYIGSVDDIT